MIKLLNKQTFLRKTLSRNFTSQTYLSMRDTPTHSDHKFYEADRDDFHKYSYLQGAKTFNEVFDEQTNPDMVHTNLKRALQQNNFKYLTDIQQRCIDEGILEGQNMIITSESGSGKTLSYLLPVINHINHFKEQQAQDLNLENGDGDEPNPETNGGYFKLSASTEESMFKNADEIHLLEKNKKKQFSLSQTNESPMKGAIILSYSKELINQIYVQARKLDTNNWILVNRATSSLQMKSPIVEFITPDQKNGTKEYSDDELFNISLANVINNASWKITDVMLSTPLVMSHILESKYRYSPLDINPKTIIIDEFDELIQSPQLKSHLIKILKKFGSKDKASASHFGGEVNSQRQFIFCGSTIPRQFFKNEGFDLDKHDDIGNGQSVMESLEQWFPNLKHVKSSNAHTVSPLIEHEWINVNEAIEVYASQDTSDEQKELDLLIDIIKRSQSMGLDKQIMIFAETKKTIDKICDALIKAEIKSLPYYPDIAVQGRAMTLMLFQSQQLPVLVCNNLAARGLDTQNVGHVIQFDLARTTVDYFHRIGRVGRMGQKGSVVSNFVRSNEMDMAKKITRALKTEGGSWDTLLSTQTPRKRRHNN